MAGPFTENDRLPERAPQLAIPEADKPWFEQLWFSDLVATALPVLAIAVLMLIGWLWWRGRRS